MTAENAIAAQETLTPAAIRMFDCVVTDYCMPEQSGLDLLSWIKSRDPNLATIIVTAEGERELIAASLRAGAVDFLDKPIDLEKLRFAVTQAVRQTRRQRSLAESESAVQDLGRVQERMLVAQAARSPVRMDVCFHPKHPAGGDFFTRFQPAPHQTFCLLTDVSGHDLEAAYISAYFQGVVRGMLERGGPVQEIFAAFNRLLLEEWNHTGGWNAPTTEIKASVAACAILIDSAADTATVLAHGMPAPVYWLADGTAQVIGDTGGFPLGWFPDISGLSVVQPTPGGGSFCLWTDGLEEVAAQQGVSELSFAWALQRAQRRNEKLSEIHTALDDILVADIHLSPVSSALDFFRPLILEQYHGGQTGEIDEMQAFWRRSLKLAAPELPEDKLHDILLSSREMLLNALHHGCQGRADQKADFQAAYSPALQTIRVRVCDPGHGHQFNVARREERAAQELTQKHLGLVLTRHLATKMEAERGGATVIMDFAWR